MTPATEATMTLEMVIGNDLFCSKATWISLGSAGWKLDIHDEGPTLP